MKVSELKSWIWNTVLEDNPRIPLDANLVLDVQGVYCYTIDENMNFIKKNDENADESITVKKFLDSADAHGDKEIDCGHEFTEDYVYSRRSLGNVLWITLVPADGEVPAEEETPTAEAAAEA